MKIIVRSHSPSTKISDLLLAIFGIAYFVAGQCFMKDMFACVLFLLFVLCIILIKYLKISENEKQ